MTARVIAGDVRSVLPTLPDASVQCCATSPPYFGLRDYGVAGQIGLEPSLDAYVAELVAVFREVKRVLRDDGTLWLNLGDSYCGYWGDKKAREEGRRSSADTNGWTNGFNMNARPKYRDAFGDTDIKPKDLMGVPWMVAFALRADGWWLRSDIVWHKPNPMPESVTDRPTKSHEYLFLLTKSAKYFFDQEAVKEKGSWQRENNPDWQYQRAETNGKKGAGNRNAADGGFTQWQPEQGRNIRSVWTIPTHSFSAAHFATFPPALVEPCVKAGTSEKGCCAACGAPWARLEEKGSTTRQTFAGSNGQQEHPPGVSHTLVPVSRRTIGWEPQCACDADADLLPDDFEVIQTPTGERAGDDPSLFTGRAGMSRPRGENEGQRPITRYEQRRYAEQLRLSPHRAQMEGLAGEAFAHYIRTDRSGARPVPPELLEDWIGRGWLGRVHLPERRPMDPVPCTVLDPFGGAGTVGLVAERLGRDSILIELNPEYAEMARGRIAGDAPLLNTVLSA